MKTKEFLKTTAKILVIEDDSSISELICMNLEAAGYKTVAIMDGTVAEAYLREPEREEIALALVDVMLPGKDGFSLMEDLQKEEIPVIYLTAKDDVVSKVHGLKAGAEDYIVKPFEVLELLVRMEKVLKRTGRGRTQCNHRREKGLFKANGVRAFGDPGRHQKRGLFQGRAVKPDLGM